MTLFRDKAPGIMVLLMKDFSLSVEEAAAIVGNLGHESGGFRFLQEIKPTVPGSRGGYGWAQWTGPRRVEFEAYCTRNKLDPRGDKANYGFLFVELTTTEVSAIKALRLAVGLDAKVLAFEQHFERAGVVNMASRVNYAKQAIDAYKASSIVKPLAVPKPPVVVNEPAIVPAAGAAPPKTLWGAILQLLSAIFTRRS